MALWTPARFNANLKAWWFADAITGLNDGDAISTWTDSTANAYALTSTGSNRPTYKTGIQNGLPVVRFAAASSQRLSVVSTLGISAQPLTIVAVWKMSASAINQALNQWSAGGSGSATYVNSGDANLHINAGAEIQTAITKGAFRLTVSLFNGASSAIVIDGATPFTGNTGTTIHSGTLRVGCNGAVSGYFLDGDIAEFFVTDTALSTTDRQLAEGYLAHKWGLSANLPSDHPHKTFPPRIGGSGLRYALGTGLRNRVLGSRG